MAQWIYIFQNNSFVNPTRLSLLCRNSAVVALAEPSLTADWLAWLADEMRVNFKFLKFIVDKLFATFYEVTALLEQYECI